MILPDQAAVVLDNAPLGYESSERPHRLNGLYRTVWAIASNMRRKGSPQLLFLLVQLLVPDKLGRIITSYGMTGQIVPLACGTIIPNAASKSDQVVNAGWGYLRGDIKRKDDFPGKLGLSVPGIHSHVFLQHTWETCQASVDFASLHIGKCGQEEVLWPSKSLSTYLRAT